jgi:hypothetical protein
MTCLGIDQKHQSLTDDEKWKWKGFQRLETLSKERKTLTDRIERMDKNIKRISHLKR